MRRKIVTTVSRLVVCLSFLLVGLLQAADVVFVDLQGHTDAVSSAAFSPDGEDPCDGKQGQNRPNLGHRGTKGIA